MLTEGDFWAKAKLTRVAYFLSAFTREFSSYRTIYVDAFAGAGKVQLRKIKTGGFFKFSNDPVDGSTRRALQTDPPFDRHVFIEKNPKRIRILNDLRDEFSEAVIQIENEESNSFIREYCNNMNWKNRRACFFLDPFGIQVRWGTLKAIARTQSACVWYLFPLGIAVNRLLAEDRSNVTEQQQRQLNRIFGINDWYEEFYRVSRRATLQSDFHARTAPICENCQASRHPQTFHHQAQGDFSLCRRVAVGPLQPGQQPAVHPLLRLKHSRFSGSP
jgi:three-Cys-motif partner protein